MIASFGQDLFQGILQGLPPGTVYGLIALGFVLGWLLLQLAVTALNGAQWGVARPFYIHV